MKEFRRYYDKVPTDPEEFLQAEAKRKVQRAVEPHFT